MLRSTFIRAAIAGVAVFGLTACGGNDNQLGGGDAGGGSAPDKVDSITIGSADFTESQLIAAIFGQALSAKGISVKQQPNIGSRETYMNAIKDGSVHLLPEYTGAALAYFDKNATETEDQAVYDKLKTSLPSGLEILNKSEAADEDAVIVTQATAQKYNLKSIADLKPVAKEIVVGGSTEFKVRTAGLKGMKDKYGIDSFKEYKTLDAGGPLSLKALLDNKIQVTNLFTTNAAIKENNLVQLEDPENILPPNQVVPLIRTDHKSADVTDTLNKVMAALTTADLTEMDKRIDVGKESTDAVAKDWISKHPVA
ncbi:MAG TPA: ABC transporter substrate-binding protein [Kribbellaceae bacterium]